MNKQKYLCNKVGIHEQQLVVSFVNIQLIKKKISFLYIMIKVVILHIKIVFS